MSNGVLVIAETRRGEVRDATAELVAAGLAIKEDGGGQLQLACLAESPDRYSERLAFEGVDEVLLVGTPTPEFEPHIAERALVGLIEREDPRLVLIPHSVDGLSFASAVAARLGLGFASDVITVKTEPEGILAQRGAYGEKLISELEFPDKGCVLLTLRTGERPPAANLGSVPTREVNLDFEEVPSEHLGFRDAPSDGLDISKAEFLISIGRGVDEEERIPQFEALAEQAGATLTASRPLVDAGWMPPTRLVGQSGKIVAPNVYLALGISGAVQHLAGMQKAKTIIAVNQDPEAPIFHVAHYGAVADIFEVAEELGELLD